MLPAQLSTPDGSKPLFSGLPDFVYGILDLEEDLLDILAEAYDTVLQAARKELRDRLDSDPDWKPYVDNVELNLDEDAFTYYLTGSDEEIESMRELEYGVPGRPHRSLLRPLTLRQTVKMRVELEKLLREEVPVA